MEALGIPLDGVPNPAIKSTGINLVAREVI
jgi:hypothetical protein